MLVKCLGEAQWLKRAWVRGLDELWFTGPASTRRLEGRNASWTASVEIGLLNSAREDLLGVLKRCRNTIAAHIRFLVVRIAE